MDGGGRARSVGLEHGAGGPVRGEIIRAREAGPGVERGRAMTKLHELFDQQGQSPWIDNLKRSFLTSGRLAELADLGVRGVTSNPTIFAKAIEGGDDYDDQYRSLSGRMSVDEAYWELVIDDIINALGVLRPLYDSSGGTDGFVSLGVAPGLVHDTDARHDADGPL